MLPGGALPLVDGHVIVNIDATLVASHSEKELAAPNYKRGFGFHPILAFADHGAGGTGTPLAAILRPGNAGSNTATDHVAVTALALAQLDSGHRDRVLVRADSAGGTKAFTHHLADAGLDYSLGFPGFLAHLKAAIDTVEEGAWVPAIDAGGDLRDGAWVAEITGLANLPYSDAASNAIWIQVVLLAMDLSTLTQPGPGLPSSTTPYGTSHGSPDSHPPDPAENTDPDEIVGLNPHERYLASWCRSVHWRGIKHRHWQPHQRWHRPTGR